MRPTVVLPTLALTLVACSDAFSPPADFRYSAAAYTCLVATTEIDLANKPITQSNRWTFPYVQLLLPQEPTDLRAGRLPSLAGVAARYVKGFGDFVIADSGSVTIQHASNLFVLGNVDLHFPNTRITGDFQAPWINEGGICVAEFN
jgi:hypothetical protein